MSKKGLHANPVCLSQSWVSDPFLFASVLGPHRTQWILKWILCWLNSELCRGRQWPIPSVRLRGGTKGVCPRCPQLTPHTRLTEPVSLSMPPSRIMKLLDCLLINKQKEASHDLRGFSVLSLAISGLKLTCEWNAIVHLFFVFIVCMLVSLQMTHMLLGETAALSPRCSLEVWSVAEDSVHPCGPGRDSLTFQPDSHRKLTSSKFKFKSKNRSCGDEPVLTQLSFLQLISWEYSIP